MIKHSVATRDHGVTTYMYASEMHHEKAFANGERSMQVMYMAHTAYNHTERQFTKHRSGNVELMNAMLLVARNQHLISIEMRNLVEEFTYA